MVRPGGSEVEAQLRGGGLRCPGCEGELRPWGSARRRLLRGLREVCPIRPRRSRCRGCGATHVLLPTVALLRRADVAEIIGDAVEAKARGQGHRRIAARLNRPPTTVREWLRRFAARAREIREHFTRLAHRLGAELGAVQPRASPLADALEAIGIAARASAGRWGAASSWHFVAGATGGRLLANTGSPFPALA